MFLCLLSDPVSGWFFFFLQVRVVCVSLPSSLPGTSHPLLNREWDLFYPWYILLQLFWGIWQATGFVCLFCNWPPNWTRSSAGRDPFPVAFLECLISVSFCGSSVFCREARGRGGWLTLPIPTSQAAARERDTLPSVSIQGSISKQNIFLWRSLLYVSWYFGQELQNVLHIELKTHSV